MSGGPGAPAVSGKGERRKESEFLKFGGLMPFMGAGRDSKGVEPASATRTGAWELERRKARPVLRTGNGTLDQLLGGGIELGTVYLLYSASRRLSRLLQQLAVLAQLPGVDGGFNAGRVLYVDGENTFDPYGIAQHALARRLDPTNALRQVTLARAFTWAQMVELVSEKIEKVEGVEAIPLVCIAGLTALMPPEQGADWHGVMKVIQGVKNLLARTRDGPAVVATTRLHPQSQDKPLGGTALRHFAHVLVRVEERPKVTEYALEQHPSRRCQRLLDFERARGVKPPAKTATLDFFLQRDAG